MGPVCGWTDSAGVKEHIIGNWYFEGLRASKQGGVSSNLAFIPPGNENDVPRPRSTYGAAMWTRVILCMHCRNFQSESVWAGCAEIHCISRA